MVDRLEENLGKYPFVTMEQVKDYLSISSNTADARLSNVINYATGMVEHYIGQEILANDYVEVFDGGKPRSWYHVCLMFIKLQNLMA